LHKLKTLVFINKNKKAHCKNGHERVQKVLGLPGGSGKFEMLPFTGQITFYSECFARSPMTPGSYAFKLGRSKYAWFLLLSHLEAWFALLNNHYYFITKRTISKI